MHALRERGLNVVCLDARHGSAALKMQMNKTDQKDAEGLAQIMRTRSYRSVHVKSLDAHRARALLGARAQLVGMTTRLFPAIACDQRTNLMRCLCLTTERLDDPLSRELRFRRVMSVCGL